MISKNTYFSGFLCGFLTGVSIFYFLEDFILSCIILSFLLILFLRLLVQNRQLYNFIFLTSFFVFLGVLYASLYSYNIDKKVAVIDRYIGEYNTYTGRVEELYKRSDFQDEYLVKLTSISDKKTPSNISHVLRIPKNFSLHPGQEIGYSGKLYKLEDFDGFSYEKYMLSKGIYFSTSSNIIDNISNIDVKGFSYYMYISREKLLNRIGNIFPEREAIFLGGILFGARENIPKDLKEDFNNSGLTHFIAVSGFNITLCIIFVTFLFGFLPAWGRIFMVSATIIIFSIFVGLGAPVVRASIMGIIGYIFLQNGNTAKNITLLLFTAVCMTLWSPLSLMYDVSLHLSFLAVVGIIYTQDFFGSLFKSVPNTFAIREALVLTFAALSFSLPIMMFQFGQVSLLAPLSNIAVTWTIPLAMLGGAVTLIADFVYAPMGKILGFFEWLLLRYDMFIVNFFGNIDSALWKVDFGTYGFYLECLYFIVLIYLLSLYHLCKKKQP